MVTSHIMANMNATEESPDPVLPQTDDLKRSINSYYGCKVGLLQTTSLVLNTGLMIYAHIGLSGVVLSSFNPSITSSNSENTVSDFNITSCNEQDEEIWSKNGGQSTLPIQSDFCIRTYNGGCFTNTTCTESCFKEMHGYSDDCAICFGSLPLCGVNSGCTFICLADSTSAECLECLVPCVEQFNACSDLPEVFENVTIHESDNATMLLLNEATGNSCNNFDLEAIETWYNVYNLTFVGSVQDSWDNGAKMLACVIVLFSGVWPYAKNIMLLIVWFMPMTVEHQTSALLWLSRLSKYSLVDVFAVIGVLVGVQLQLNIGGFAEAVIRAEPRFGIICFFLATVWEFLQIELIKAMHERKVLRERRSQDGEERLLFSQLWIPVLILLASIGLYVSGTVMEFIFISSTDIGSDGVCIKSFNIVQLGNALINEISMTGNSAAGQTRFLYLVYVVLILALPILTHLMQIIFIIGRFQSKRLKGLIQWASVIWCLACIEVLLIGTFAVESKFDQFIMNVAGIENEDILDVKSGLGSGFYILIAYSVVACVLQFSLGIRHDSSGQPSPKSVDVDEKESDPV
mmetsp:Transcript_43887/g.78764  ORF Transcript_43887/g.78764 Transcript_43887/m.78764 type:complete len:574 (-) Transcript_43887:175-1896(-)